MSRTSEEFENRDGRWTHLTDLAERFYQPFREVAEFIREVLDTPVVDGNFPRAEKLTMAFVCAIVMLTRLLSYAGILDTKHSDMVIQYFGIPILVVIFLRLDLFAVMENLVQFYVNRPRRSGLSQSEIRMIPKTNYGRLKLNESYDCSICLELIKDEDEVRLLRSCISCKHYYHILCIDRWLHISKYCPTCRSDVASQKM